MGVNHLHCGPFTSVRIQNPNNTTSHGTITRDITMKTLQNRVSASITNLIVTETTSSGAAFQF